MIRLRAKTRDHLPLRFPMAYKRAITTRAKCQRKRIEQDRFSRARFTRQNAQAPIKGEIEAINKNNVADGEMSQHGPMKRLGVTEMQVPLRRSSPS